CLRPEAASRSVFHFLLFRGQSRKAVHPGSFQGPESVEQIWDSRRRGRGEPGDSRTGGRRFFGPTPGTGKGAFAGGGETLRRPSPSAYPSGTQRHSRDGRDPRGFRTLSTGKFRGHLTRDACPILTAPPFWKIGRASCRERLQVSVCAA